MLGHLLNDLVRNGRFDLAGDRAVNDLGNFFQNGRIVAAFFGDQDWW